MTPTFDLPSQICRGLACKRWIGWTHPLASNSVTARAGGQSPRRIADRVKDRRGERRRFRGRDDVHTGVVARNSLSFCGTELLRDPAHLHMTASAVSVRFKLPLEIAKVEICKARTACTIAASVEAMAGEAGIGGACARPAEGDQFPRGPETLGRPVLDGRARRQSARQHERAGQLHRCPWEVHQTGGTDGNRRRFRPRTPAVRLMRNPLPRATEIIPVLVLLTSACKPPPDERQSMPIANAARGKAAIERVGCASCHDIAGIQWPKGSVGPAIETMRDRALIAGRVPNEPDMLARFVRNAPALVPGTTMPQMPLTEQDSRDVAAYLYEIGG